MFVFLFVFVCVLECFYLCLNVGVCVRVCVCVISLVMYTHYRQVYRKADDVEFSRTSQFLPLQHKSVPIRGTGCGILHSSLTIQHSPCVRHCVLIIRLSAYTYVSTHARTRRFLHGIPVCVYTCKNTQVSACHICIKKQSKTVSETQDGATKITSDFQYNSRFCFNFRFLPLQRKSVQKRRTRCGRYTGNQTFLNFQGRVRFFRSSARAFRYVERDV